MIITRLSAACRRCALAVTLGCAVLLGAPAASQEIQKIDPDTVIDGDLANPQSATAAPPAAPADSGAASPGFAGVNSPPTSAPATSNELPSTEAPAAATSSAASSANQADTYSAAELLPAAQGVFGKGARGLGEMIQDLLKKQGRPDGYIVGDEGGAAFIFGLRYGGGTLYHKIEGKREVHWTGPSLGADLGASGGKTFILVYNLYDTDDLFHRYTAGEGQAYLLGGFNISELRRGNVVLIPVRMGVGLRLGLNVGYMKFSKKSKILPF